MGRSGDPKLPDSASEATRPIARREASAPAELHPEFEPLKRAIGARRIALYVVGPLLWVAALVVVSYVVHHGEAVGIALLVLAGAAVVALGTLVPMRARRVHNERES